MLALWHTNFGNYMAIYTAYSLTLRSPMAAFPVLETRTELIDLVLQFVVGDRNN